MQVAAEEVQVEEEVQVYHFPMLTAGTALAVDVLGRVWGRRAEQGWVREVVVVEEEVRGCSSACCTRASAFRMRWIGSVTKASLIWCHGFRSLLRGGGVGGEMLEMYGATGQEEEKEEEGKEEGGQIGAEPAPRYFRE